jgi:dTMP kinase
MPGLFIVIEGTIGVGKSTTIKALVKALEQRGHDVYHTVAPSTGPVGQFIRELLKRPDYTKIDMNVLRNLYLADHYYRNQFEIQPALAAGKTIVSDRYYHSGMALNNNDWSDANLEREHVRYKELPKPDISFVLTASPETIMARQMARADFASGRKVIPLEEIERQVNAYNRVDWYLTKQGENCHSISLEGTADQAVFDMVTKLSKLIWG